jgi:hypothetical protein
VVNEMEEEAKRGNRTALIIALLAALCLVPLVLFERKQCGNPTTERVGGIAVWDQCGTERKREAINDE